MGSSSAGTETSRDPTGTLTPEMSATPPRTHDDESADPRGATGTFSPAVEDPKDARDPAAALGMREHFTLQEAIRVLSHFDLGVVERVREFRRGSRRSPKLRIFSELGQFLLKRRAPGRDDEARVDLAHQLQARLSGEGFPIAPLIPTRDGATVVRVEGRTYELFRYVESSGYAKSPEAAAAAGDALGRLHAITGTFTHASELSHGSFHASRNVEQAFEQIPTAVQAVEPSLDERDLARTCRLLRKGYLEAMRRVETSGWAEFPRQVIHGDWHPGNVLFQDERVVAVLDFDSARIEPRVVDVANGLIQFTMLMSADEDPTAWPEGFDGRRMESFLQSYDLTVRSDGTARPTERRQDAGLSKAEQDALPWLMVEALIAETALPIAATGSFAAIRGSSFLAMIERKVDWIWRRSARIKRLLA